MGRKAGAGTYGHVMEQGWARAVPDVGAWIVRWCDVEGHEGKRRLSGATKEQAAAKVDEIAASLRETGLYTWVDPTAQRTPDFLHLVMDHLTECAAAKKGGSDRPKYAADTMRIKYYGYDALEPAIRVATGLAEGPVPATIMDRDIAIRVHSALGVYKAAQRRAAWAVLQEAWARFGGDAKRRIPHMPGGLPIMERRKYGRVPQATLAEVDAVVRRIEHRPSRLAAMIMRAIGLRAGQVLRLEIGDLDRMGRLHIRSDLAKTEGEASMIRILPLPTYLLDEIRWLTLDRTAGPIVDFSYHTVYSRTSAAWKKAIENNEVRPEVYKPSNRGIARPDHAFRGFVQTHLRRAGIPDVTIDVIVGHSEGSTRDRHYHEVTDDELREALACIPAPAGRPPAALRSLDGGLAAASQ